MKEYVVYFDVFGKKLRTRVEAKTPEDAAAYVRRTIDIKKIVEVEPEKPIRPTKPMDTVGDMMKDMERTMRDLFGDNAFNQFFKNKK